MSKLYLETNRNTSKQIICSLLMRLISKIEYLIMPKGVKFTELGILGLNTFVCYKDIPGGMGFVKDHVV